MFSDLTDFLPKMGRPLANMTGGVKIIRAHNKSRMGIATYFFFNVKLSFRNAVTDVTIRISFSDNNFNIK